MIESIKQIWSSFFSKKSSAYHNGQGVQQKTSLGTIVWAPESRTRQTTGSLKYAINAAESPYRPDRTALYQIHDDIVLDLHLGAQIRSRENRVKTMPIKVYGQQKENYKLNDWLKKQAFVTEIMSAYFQKLWSGHALVELTLDASTGKISTYVFPKSYVSPELRMIKQNLNDEFSIPYSNVLGVRGNVLLFEIGKPYELGLLTEAARMGLTKKSTLSFWGEYAEQFGSPMRIGKTSSNDPGQKQQMLDQLRELGSAAAAVIDHGDDIQIVKDDGRGSNVDVFDKLVRYADEQFSKGIVGQTMTADGGQSRAQAEVHQDTFEQLILADKLAIEQILNCEVVPWLVSNGLIPEGVSFELDAETELSLTIKLNRLVQILAYYDVDAQYLYEEFGIPANKKSIKNPA